MAIIGGYFQSIAKRGAQGSNRPRAPGGEPRGAADAHRRIGLHRARCRAIVGRSIRTGAAPRRSILVHRSSRAFSLVELLVVIAIIAVLMGILLPVISAARRQANIVVCTATLREMTSAATMCAQEHRGYMPLAGELAIQGTSIDPVNFYPTALNDPYRRRYTYAVDLAAGSAYVVVPLTGALGPYMGVKDLPWEDFQRLDQRLNDQRYWRRFLCPATDSFNKPRASTDPNDTTLVGQGTMMSLFSIDSGGAISWSTNTDYAVNEGVFGFHSNPRYESRRLRGNTAKFRRSDELVLFTDANIRKTPAYPWRSDPWICWTPSLAGSGPVTLADALLNNGKAADPNMFDRDRHKGRINIAFADGHVSTTDINAKALERAYLLPP